jgi:hypothetical protein
MFLKGNLGYTDYGVSLAGMIHALTSLHSLLRTEVLLIQWPVMYDTCNAGKDTRCSTVANPQC